MMTRSPKRHAAEHRRIAQEKSTWRYDAVLDSEHERQRSRDKMRLAEIELLAKEHEADVRRREAV
jgi:hypothetical protein